MAIKEMLLQHTAFLVKLLRGNAVSACVKFRKRARKRVDDDFLITVPPRTTGPSEKYHTLVVFKFCRFIDSKESQWFEREYQGPVLFLPSDILRQCTYSFWKGALFLDGPFALNRTVAVS